MNMQALMSIAKIMLYTQFILVYLSGNEHIVLLMTLVQQLQLLEAYLIVYAMARMVPHETFSKQSDIKKYAVVNVDMH